MQIYRLSLRFSKCAEGAIEANIAQISPNSHHSHCEFASICIFELTSFVIYPKITFAFGVHTPLLSSSAVFVFLICDTVSDSDLCCFL